VGVFDVGPGGVRVLETYGTSIDELAARLDVPLQR
jgi:3-oxoadipate CoA-transferase, beta subunit